MFCENCDDPIKAGVKFCGACGSPLSSQAVKRPEPEQAISEKNPKGLGGWLILVILGLFITVLLQLYNIYVSVTLFTDGTVDFISDPSSDIYIPGYGGLLKFEFIGEIIFLAAAVYLIYLFFRKSRQFPKYFVIFLIASAAYIILDYLLLSSTSVSAETQEFIDDALSDQNREVARAFIGALIWGAYMKKSKRVKATFIED